MKTETSLNHETPPIANVLLADSALQDCTVRPRIIVGQKVPNEISLSYEGGGGWVNMGSFNMDLRFRNHLKTFQEEEYEFSVICRNENEKQAFELAIKENCESIGLNVVGYVD